MKSPFNSGCVYVVFRIGYFTKVVFPIPITLLILANLAPRRALNRLSVRKHIRFSLYLKGVIGWYCRKPFFFFFRLPNFAIPESFKSNFRKCPSFFRTKLDCISRGLPNHQPLPSGKSAMGTTRLEIASTWEYQM